jgi:hypothetical protein
MASYANPCVAGTCGNQGATGVQIDATGWNESEKRSVREMAKVVVLNSKGVKRMKPTELTKRNKKDSVFKDIKLEDFKTATRAMNRYIKPPKYTGTFEDGTDLCMAITGRVVNGGLMVEPCKAEAEAGTKKPIPAKKKRNPTIPTKKKKNPPLKAMYGYRMTTGDDDEDGSFRYQVNVSECIETGKLPRPGLDTEPNEREKLEPDFWAIWFFPYLEPKDKTIYVGAEPFADGAPSYGVDTVGKDPEQVAQSLLKNTPFAPYTQDNGGYHAGWKFPIDNSTLVIHTSMWKDIARKTRERLLRAKTIYLAEHPYWNNWPPTRA